jgi:hypothetical protein
MTLVGDDVDMEVRVYSSARGAAEVQAYVEPVRAERAVERLSGTAGEFPQFAGYASVKSVKVCGVRVRHYHEMPVVVGEQVQDDETFLPTEEHQVFSVICLFPLFAENAPRAVLAADAGDVRHSPRRP